MASLLWAGCGGGTTAGWTSSFSPGTDTAAPWGRWSDLDAAIHYALPDAELAIVRVEEPDDTGRVYELLSVRDEAVLVRATASPPGEDGARQIESISASWGLFGDEQREQELLDALGKRLRALERDAARRRR